MEPSCSALPGKVLRRNLPFMFGLGLAGVVAALYAATHLNGCGHVFVEPVCQQATGDLRELDQAIRMYWLRSGEYPPTEGWDAALRREGLVDSGSRFTDPWGHPYVYYGTADGFELASVGADGLVCTEDDQVQADRYEWHTCRSPGFFSGCRARF
jgi:hypothetical protein